MVDFGDVTPYLLSFSWCSRPFLSLDMPNPTSTHMNVNVGKSAANFLASMSKGLSELTSLPGFQWL